jgi:hypothetical protein
LRGRGGREDRLGEERGFGPWLAGPACRRVRAATSTGAIVEALAAKGIVEDPDDEEMNRTHRY